MRILVSGPLIKNIETTIFKTSRQQRQSLALAVRQREGRKLPLVYLHLVIQLQFSQVPLRHQIQIRIIKTQKTLEQIEISEDGREVLPVSFPVFVRDQFAIDTNLSMLGNVQSCNEFRQSSLAASVTSDHKDQLPTP